jgi:hypothetical protein
MQCLGETLVLFSGTGFLLYDPVKHSLSELSYPVRKVISSCILGPYLYLLTGTHLQVYAFH